MLLRNFTYAVFTVQPTFVVFHFQSTHFQVQEQRQREKNDFSANNVYFGMEKTPLRSHPPTRHQKRTKIKGLRHWNATLAESAKGMWLKKWYEWMMRGRTSCHWQKTIVDVACFACCLCKNVQNINMHCCCLPVRWWYVTWHHQAKY